MNKQKVLIKLDEAKDLLDDDAEYNFGVVKIGGNIIKFVIEDQRYDVLTETG